MKQLLQKYYYWLMPLGYMSIIALGMMEMHRKGIKYGEAGMALALLPFELIASIFAITAYFATSQAHKMYSFRVPKHTPLFYLWPFLLLYLFIAILIGYNFSLMSSTLTTQDWHQWYCVMITTALVGFSEELMYRGILLRQLLVRYSEFSAIVLSAIGFSLLHSINFFASLSAFATLSQMCLTFIVGVTLAWLVIRVRRLWPLMLIHWLRDLVLLSPPKVLDGLELFIILMISLDLVFFIVAIFGRRVLRKGH